MTKFNYPAEGIKTNIDHYLGQAKKNTNDAVNDCSLDIPYGFAYKSHLSNLYDTLVEMKEEMDVIDRLIKRADDDYKTMSSDIQSNLQNIDLIKIKERDRMII